MKIKYLFTFILVFCATGLLMAQQNPRKLMKQNPEYLDWLRNRERNPMPTSTNAFPLKNTPTKIPVMQPNPEYLLWHRALSRNPLPTQPVFVNRPRKDIILGIGFTGTGYYGDLNYSPDGIFNSKFFAFNPGINLTLRRDAPKFILPVFNIGYGKFVAQNGDLKPVVYNYNDVDTLIQPNTYAETMLIHGEFGIHINLIRRDALFKPFLGVGIGGLAFFPRAQDGILLFRKRSTRAPGEPNYGTLAISFPLTVGTDITLGRRVSLNLAYIFRANTTDYLDNIGELGAKEGNDQLHVFRLGLNFRVLDVRRLGMIPR